CFGIMWLTLVGSPLSGSANRQSPANSCWRSNIAARLSAPPRSLGWVVTSAIRSPSTQISRFVLRSPSRNCDPVRAAMPSPPPSGALVLGRDVLAGIIRHQGGGDQADHAAGRD